MSQSRRVGSRVVWVLTRLAMALALIGSVFALPMALFAEESSPVPVDSTVTPPPDTGVPTVGMPNETLIPSDPTATAATDGSLAAEAPTPAPQNYDYIELKWRDSAGRADAYPGTLCLNVNVEPATDSGTFIVGMCNASMTGFVGSSRGPYQRPVNYTYYGVVVSNNTGCDVSFEPFASYESNGLLHGTVSAVITCTPPTATTEPSPTPVPPTATATNTPDPTATATSTPEPTATLEPTVTATATPVIVKAKGIGVDFVNENGSSIGLPGPYCFSIFDATTETIILDQCLPATNIGSIRVYPNGRTIAHEYKFTEIDNQTGCRTTPSDFHRAYKDNYVVTVTIDCRSTPTATATSTPDPTATATNTQEPTDTPVPTPTATNTPDPTATITTTAEPTETPVLTATATVTPEPTATSAPVNGAAIIAVETSDGSALPDSGTVCLAGSCMPLNSSSGIAANRAAFAAPDRSTASFTFAEVVPGHYVARVLDAGSSVIAEGPVDVAAGQIVHITVVVQISQSTSTATTAVTATTSVTPDATIAPSQTAKVTSIVSALPNTGSIGEGGSSDGPVLWLFLSALVMCLIGAGAWRGRRSSR